MRKDTPGTPPDSSSNSSPPWWDPSQLDLDGLKSHLSHRASEEWGRWLSGLYPWDWFVTMTFRDTYAGVGDWKSRNGHRGRTRTRVGWSAAKRAWLHFVRECEGRIGQPGSLVWARFFEVQRRGVPHIHALVGRTGKLRRMDLVDWCWKHYGIARIYAYNPKLGAGYYITKYVTKAIADVEFSANLEREVSQVNINFDEQEAA